MTPEEEAKTENCEDPRNDQGVRRLIVQPALFFAFSEPLWVGLAVALVYAFYLLQTGWSLALTSVALALAFLPFGVRILARRSPAHRTPFDVTLAVLMIGAVVGLIVSPVIATSAGAFQCMLALCFFYYSVLGYRSLHKIVKPLLFGSLVPLAAFYVVALAKPDGFTGQADEAGCTYHGVALGLVIILSLFAGIAVFGRKDSARRPAILVSICLIGAVAYQVSDSIPRLVGWETVEGRLPRWEHTIDLLRENPITGLGLGGWGYAYHGSEILTHPTHAHNAYLELYANTGLLGVLALAVALFVGTKLAWGIIRSPRNHPWYGFGVGVVLACVATLLVGIVESAPVGVPMVAEDTYYYLISPVPWILAGLLVAANNLIKTEVKE